LLVIQSINNGPYCWEAMKKNKCELITFKVDASLLEALKGIPNRSEFIRTAVLASLEGACPLCNGTGTLTPNQKSHWQAFSADHSVEECEQCHELRLVCSNSERRCTGRRIRGHKNA